MSSIAVHFPVVRNVVMVYQEVKQPIRRMQECKNLTNIGNTTVFMFFCGSNIWRYVSDFTPALSQVIKCPTRASEQTRTKVGWSCLHATWHQNKFLNCWLYYMERQTHSKACVGLKYFTSKYLFSEFHGQWNLSIVCGELSWIHIVLQIACSLY